MLDEYIKELIANNNRVIIPNFGAFLLRATSKNKNKKDLSSKINDIYFSPFLKFNDELLMNHVIKKENVTQREAMDMITKYISNIENFVKENGAYQIEGFGEFYMDNQGKIQFRIQPSAQKKEATKKKQAPPPDTSESTKTTGTSSTINEKAASRKRTVSESKEEEKKEEEKQGKTEKQETPTYQKKTTPTAKKERSTGKTPPPPPKKEKADTGASSQKSNKGLILSIVIGVPVAVLFLWAMLNFDTVQSFFDKDERKEPITDTTEKDDEQQTDQQEEEPTGSEEPTSDEQEEQSDQEQDMEADQSEQQPSSDQDQEIKQASGDKKYYIVAGSFKNKENAVSFHKDLLDKGYDSEMIGKRDSMHAVSYASFNSKSQAEEELQRFRNEEGVQAWLLHY